MAGRVVAEARPGPLFWLGNQSAHDGIAVHVAEFLDTRFFIVNIEVGVAGLPEGPSARRRATESLSA
jgi:hypothetical protein